MSGIQIGQTNFLIADMLNLKFNYWRRHINVIGIATYVGDCHVKGPVWAVTSNTDTHELV